MKTPFQGDNGPQGPEYWRSLDELAATPEFNQWLEREFPEGASEWSDPVSRRHFVKLMSASFLLAGIGLSGCRRPEEIILPFSNKPAGYDHGVAQFFATAFPTRGTALPVLAKSHEGRPVKLEGNADHPDSHGSTDIITQASVLNLYDPDRAKDCRLQGGTVSLEQALEALDALGQGAAKDKGRGLAILAGRSSSPSRERLLGILRKNLPQASWYEHEAIDFDIHRQAATAAFGKPVRPRFELGKARALLSLDCDFLGDEENAVNHIRGFSEGRRLVKPGDRMNRLYAVEGVYSLTGANADHRLRLAPGLVHGFAVVVAKEVLKQLDGASSRAVTFINSLAEPSELGFDRAWAVECAKDLVRHQGDTLVLAGYRQSLGVHLIACALNQVLGNVGHTLQLLPAPAPVGKGITELVADLNADKVKSLVLLGVNPGYDAPADLDWKGAVSKVDQVFRLAYYHEDESSKRIHLHLPQAHALESWGDVRTSDGTVVPVQPLIRPLFNGVTDLEVLARLAGEGEVKPHEIVRTTFRSLASSDENAWRRFLHDGYLAGSAPRPVAAAFSWKGDAALTAAPAGGAPSDEKLELVFVRDMRVDDGRYANNGWLQETPDPITKITWDNAVLMSPRTAESLNLGGMQKAESGKFHVPVVSVAVGDRSVMGPLWVQPGMADNVVAVALGYGRTSGRIATTHEGEPVGFNAYPLRTTTAAYLATETRVTPTTSTHTIACTQEHWAMEGRPSIREATHSQWTEHPDFAKNYDLEAPGHSAHIESAPNGRPKTMYKNPEYKGVHQWGMAIDLTSCVGCSACLVACQSENNIPIVGKDQVIRGREMHWIRLDRYYAGGVEDPDMIFQPMMCQHCENAPCESVCPVNATVHDEEGLNLMVYNRCVGTRYCSNNCPYKVRRFNYFDYNKRPLHKLYAAPFDPRNKGDEDGEWELKRWWQNPLETSRPEDEWELVKLVKNPDVSVRMRGVMEKCTFCVQRIEGGKIKQKVAARDTDNVRVPDGTIQTACEQACPAGAIVFGDTSDPDSRVSQLKALGRNYDVLGFLDTRPRLTYLARVRNPNPEMPGITEDYMLPSNREYEHERHSNPFETHGGGDDAHGKTHGEPHTAPQGGGQGEGGH